MYFHTGHELFYKCALKILFISLDFTQLQQFMMSPFFTKKQSFYFHIVFFFLFIDFCLLIIDICAVSFDVASSYSCRPLFIYLPALILDFPIYICLLFKYIHYIQTYILTYVF